MSRQGSLDMAAVHRKISRWRKARPRPKAMPEELWEAAASLASEHGVGRVARELGLHYAALKERTTRRGAALVPVGRSEPVEEEAQAAFVEVSPAQIFGGGPAGATVILASPDGATMTVHAPSGQPLDWASLAASFWRRGA